MANKSVCKIDECGKPVKGHGLCSGHAKRLRVHGDVRADMPLVRRVASECSVDGCAKKSHAKGLCAKHFMKFWRYGDASVRKTAENGEPTKFLSEVVLPFAGAGCLHWPYARDSRGYGKIFWSGKSGLASRLVCSLVHGDPPSPMHEAAHLCGNGHLGCVNPTHLAWKTPVGNAADKVRHGTNLQGEDHPQAKLTEGQVREIRRLRWKHTQSELSMMFGVSQCTISDIHLRKTWALLPPGDQS